MASKGRNMLIQVDMVGDGETYTTIASVRSKTLSITHSPIDVTNVDSDNYREYDANGLGERSISVNCSGIFINVESQEYIEDAANANSLVALKIIFENGDYYTGNFAIPKFEHSGSMNGVGIFSMSFESSGTITLTREGSSCPTPINCTPSSWNDVTDDADEFAAYSGIWDGSQFVLAGESGDSVKPAIATSSDGATWNVTVFGGLGFFDQFRSIGYNSSTGVYILGDDDGEIYRTTDLTDMSTTVSVSGAASGSALHQVLYNADIDVWVGACQYDYIIVSQDDGLSWTTALDDSSNNPSFSREASIIHDGTQFVAVAGGSMGESSYVPLVYTSSDGVSWSVSDVTSGVDEETGFQDIAYDCQSGLYIAVSNRYERHVYTSTDLSTWTTQTVSELDSDHNISCISYLSNLGLWMLGTYENLSGISIVYSSDGSSWSGRHDISTLNGGISGYIDNGSDTIVASISVIDSGAGETRFAYASCS